MFTDSNSTNNILTLFCVVKLIHIVYWINIWLLFNKPTNLTTKFSISDLSSWFKHCQSWCLTFVLPQVNIILWANNNVSSWHSINSNIKSYLLAFNSCTNRIAKINLGNLLIRFWKNCTKLTLAFYLSKLFHIFHKFLISLGVPKDYTKLHSIRLLKSKYQCSIGKITPFVVRTNWSAINVWSCCDCNS